VNTSVDLTKMFAPVWTVKFVNAVLRNAASSFESIPFPDPEKDIPENISVRKSFPKWLIQRWYERFGKNKTEALCDAVNTIAPITFAPMPLRTTREKLFKSLESEVGEIWTTSVSEDGISFLNPRSMISDLIAFRLGWFQVQDEAAQLMTGLLEPCPRETILDACAGLGGKTGHIAQMMKNTGHLVAMDVEKHKLAKTFRRHGPSVYFNCKNPYS
jgi:16S rRNA (cytosine967-C5)-methyltransferase